VQFPLQDRLMIHFILQIPLNYSSLILHYFSFMITMWARIGLQVIQVISYYSKHSQDPRMPISVYWKYFITSKSIHILLFPIMQPWIQSPFVYYFPPEYYWSIYYAARAVFLVVPFPYVFHLPFFGFWPCFECSNFSFPHVIFAFLSFNYF